ncbi:MAG: hypothetical protein AB1529_02850 [Candidatus Micrarchaeota archaeon]
MQNLDRKRLAEKANFPKLREVVVGVSLMLSGPLSGCGSDLSTADRGYHTPMPRVDYSDISEVEGRLVSIVRNSQNREDILRAIDGLSRLVCDPNATLGAGALVIVARWSESDLARSAAVGRLAGNADALAEVLVYAYPEDTREEALGHLLRILNNPNISMSKETLIIIATEIDALATEGRFIDSTYSAARIAAVNRLREDAGALAEIAEYSEFEDSERLARRYLRELGVQTQ